MGKGDKKAAKQGLVEKNGALTVPFRMVLGEVFRRFDVDGDGALNESELESFAVSSGTGEKIDGDERKQLGVLFEVDKAGNITKKGFEQMYLMQVSHQPEDVWRDLEKLGYDKSLELKDPAKADEEAAKEAAKAEADALQAARMEEMKEALTELKLNQDSAAAHRRVGEALEALGRNEAAAKSFLKASELDGVVETTVDDQD